MLLNRGEALVYCIWYFIWIEDMILFLHGAVGRQTFLSSSVPGQRGDMTAERQQSASRQTISQFPVNWIWGKRRCLRLWKTGCQVDIFEFSLCIKLSQIFVVHTLPWARYSLEAAQWELRLHGSHLPSASSAQTNSPYLLNMNQLFRQD